MADVYYSFVSSCAVSLILSVKSKTMSPGEFIRLQAVEITFLSVLAFLPFFVTLKEVGITLLVICLMVGSYRTVKKKLTKRVSINCKSVFITGCDTGFGYALAKRLVSLGFRVFAGCYLPDGEGAQSLKAGCGDALHIVPLDVTNDESVAKALHYVKGHLDSTVMWGLVNNAGQYSGGDVEFCTLDIYKKIMDVNMFGMVRVTRAFLPLIRRCKGRILNVTSVRGRMGGPQTAAYTMSKYAGEGFSDVLRIEMRQWGVKVVIIEPCCFAGITSVIKHKNGDRIKDELNRMWTEASPDVKEDFGKDYHFEILSDLNGISCVVPQITPVIDALEDGLVNEEPKARYLIGGLSNKYYDIFKWLVLMNTFLPEFLTDYMIEWGIWSTEFKPRALMPQ